MGSAFKFLVKAFFGGCFGCLGVLSFLVVLGLILTFAFGPSLASTLPKIPGMLFPGGLGLDSLIPGGSGEAQPGFGETPEADCYKTIDGWASKNELGEAATTFSKGDGIFPVVTNPTGCGQVTVKLLDPKKSVVMEQSFGVVGGGRNGYGNFNPDKALKPGAYKLQFWYGENLLKEIKLTIK
jgi:hypothetical protein